MTLPLPGVVSDPATQQSLDVIARAMPPGMGEGFVNVREGFGARGDGTTDDTAAIQAAIDSVAATGGGVIWFPRGVYLITAKLRIKDLVSLWGEGPGLSIIRTATNMGILVGNDDTDNGNSDITVRGLSMDGGGVVSTTVLDFRAQNGGGTSLCHRIYIDDCETYGTTLVGIHVAEVEDVRVTNCHVHDTDRDGIQIFSATRGLVQGCRIVDTGDDCISFSGIGPVGVATDCAAIGNFCQSSLVEGSSVGSGVVFTAVHSGLAVGNTIHGGTFGLSVTDWDGQDSRNIVLSGNTLENPGASYTNGGGIQIRGGFGGTANASVQKVAITGNTLINCKGHGIDVTSNSATGFVFDISIVGNQITVEDYTPNFYGNAINLDTLSTSNATIEDVSIIGNTIANPQESGIRVNAFESGDFARLSIIGNSIRNCNTFDGTEGFGIRLDGGASGVGAIDSVIIADNRATDARGTKICDYGLLVNAGANVSNVRLSGNDFSGNNLGQEAGTSSIASVGGEGIWPYAIAAGNVTANSLFVDTADSKLKYRDGAAATQVLY